MPRRADYAVKFPDGHVQKFDGPDNMSDADAFARAVQERAVASGEIQTTGMGGWFKQMGQEKAANAALIGGAGMLTGVAPVVALAPLAATWLDYATKKTTGENAPLPTAVEQAWDVAEGVGAAYGGKIISKMGGALAQEAGNLPGNTVPQVITKVTGRTLAPIAKGTEMVTPGAVNKTTSEIVKTVKNTADRFIAGVSAEDLDLMRRQVQAGMKPSTAAKIIAGKDPKKFIGLMRLYIRPVTGMTP